MSSTQQSSKPEITVLEETEQMWAQFVAASPDAAAVTPKEAMMPIWQASILARRQKERLEAEAEAKRVADAEAKAKQAAAEAAKAKKLADDKAKKLAAEKAKATAAKQLADEKAEAEAVKLAQRNTTTPAPAQRTTSTSSTGATGSKPRPKPIGKAAAQAEAVEPARARSRSKASAGAAGVAAVPVPAKPQPPTPNTERAPGEAEPTVANDSMDVDETQFKDAGCVPCAEAKRTGCVLSPVVLKYCIAYTVAQRKNAPLPKPIRNVPCRLWCADHKIGCVPVGFAHVPFANAKSKLTIDGLETSIQAFVDDALDRATTEIKAALFSALEKQEEEVIKPGFAQLQAAAVLQNSKLDALREAVFQKVRVAVESPAEQGDNAEIDDEEEEDEDDSPNANIDEVDEHGSGNTDSPRSRLSEHDDDDDDDLQAGTQEGEQQTPTSAASNKRHLTSPNSPETHKRRRADGPSDSDMETS